MNKPTLTDVFEATAANYEYDEELCFHKFYDDIADPIRNARNLATTAADLGRDDLARRFGKVQDLLEAAEDILYNLPEKAQNMKNFPEVNVQVRFNLERLRYEIGLDSVVNGKRIFDVRWWTQEAENDGIDTIEQAVAYAMESFISANS